MLLNLGHRSEFSTFLKFLHGHIDSTFLRLLRRTSFVRFRFSKKILIGVGLYPLHISVNVIFDAGSVGYHRH